KQFTTSVESLTISRGPGLARTASRAATISMRWLVERASAPLANRPPGTAQAQPPGPGFPRQAPSVYTTVGAAIPVTVAVVQSRRVVTVAKEDDAVELQIDGHAVTVSHPEKVFFPERGET